MRVREWASREGLNIQTVWKWCRENTMPVPFEYTPTGLIMIHDPKYEHDMRILQTEDTHTVCYARVSSADQETDLQRQTDRLKAFAINMGVTNPQIVQEIGSGMNGSRRKLNRILADPTITTIIVEHRDRFARMNMELVESSLQAQDRRIIVVDDHELDDDLVRDMTEVLTSFCARLYGRRSASQKAQLMLKAAES